MPKRTLLQCCASALIFLVATAHAEVTMSLTINGDPDELIAIIQTLHDLGYGEEPAAASSPLKLRMLSVASSPAEAPAPPPPALALGNAMVSPATAPPGAIILLTIDALDEKHVIDTVTARYLDQAADLFDNGMHGDAIAGDGIWTAQLVLPDTTAPGDYLVQVTAYDVQGLPLGDPLDNARMLSIETDFVVTQP